MGRTLQTFAQWRLQENMQEYSFYQQQLELYCRSMFHWQNLPDGISARFLEKSLFYNGFVVFFKSKKIGAYVVANATASGLNDYDEPIGYHCKGSNLLNEYVKASECVIIENNILRRGNVSSVNFFSKELSNIKKTFDLNLEQLKIPYFVTAPEGQVTTIQKIFEKKQNGEPYILARENMKISDFVEVFDLKVSNHTRELLEVMNSFESKAKTHFGINNLNIFKKERLVSNEPEQNNEEVVINRKLMLQTREDAVKKINEKFGLNISVEYILDSEIGGNIEGGEINA